MGDFNESTYLSNTFSYDRFEDAETDKKPKFCFQMIPKRIIVALMMFLGCGKYLMGLFWRDTDSMLAL
jgi:hypothetical protein